MGDKADKMPAWPREPFHADDAEWRSYERARYEAAMARLRVAVEALDFYANEGALFSSGARAKKAIDAIGDLPPDPTEGG